MKLLFGDAILLPPVGRSDDSVVLCPSLTNRSTPKTTKIQFRNVIPSSLTRFHQNLSQSNFLRVVSHLHDVEEADDLFPRRSVKLRSDDKPWVNKSSLKFLINERPRIRSR